MDKTGSKKLVVAGVSSEAYAVIDAQGQNLGDHLPFYGNLFGNYLYLEETPASGLPGAG